MTYKIGDLRPQFGHHGLDRPLLPRCAIGTDLTPRPMLPLSSQHLGEISIRPEPMPNLQVVCQSGQSHPPKPPVLGRTELGRS